MHVCGTCFKDHPEFESSLLYVDSQWESAWLHCTGWCLLLDFLDQATEFCKGFYRMLVPSSEWTPYLSSAQHNRLNYTIKYFWIGKCCDLDLLKLFHISKNGLFFIDSSILLWVVLISYVFFFRSEQLFVMFQCIMVVFSNACVQVRGAFSLKDVWFDRVFFLISLHSLSNHSSFFLHASYI